MSGFRSVGGFGHGGQFELCLLSIGGKGCAVAMVLLDFSSATMRPLGVQDICGARLGGGP